MGIDGVWKRKDQCALLGPLSHSEPERLDVDLGALRGVCIHIMDTAGGSYLWDRRWLSVQEWSREDFTSTKFDNIPAAEKVEGTALVWGVQQ